MEEVFGEEEALPATIVCYPRLSPPVRASVKGAREKLAAYPRCPECLKRWLEYLPGVEIWFLPWGLWREQAWTLPVQGVSAVFLSPASAPAFPALRVLS